MRLFIGSPTELFGNAFRPWHAVFVSLRSFAVQVDEEAKRETVLPNDQPVNLHRLFLGGIPAEVEQTSNRVNVPFQGCIWNLMFNTVYVTSSTFEVSLYISLWKSVCV